MTVLNSISPIEYAKMFRKLADDISQERIVPISASFQANTARVGVLEPTLLVVVDRVLTFVYQEEPPRVVYKTKQRQKRRRRHK